MPKVKDHIHALLGEGPVHATLIDPDRQSPKEAAEIASSAELGGTNLLLVGGTTGVDRSKMQSTIRSIKTVVRTPIVIFPAALESISDDADAILYISLMNSRNHEFVMRSAAMGSVEIQDSGIEPISTGYVVIDPGMLVGKIGDVDLIMRGDINSAVRYAVSAEMFGFCLFYLEGGSGVGEPVPLDMIRCVSEAVSIPLVVGGGIRSSEQAREAVESGADIIVTGTIVEGGKDITGAVKAIISGMEQGWKARA